jgi:AraC-like DNA-binding protein
VHTVIEIPPPTELAEYVETFWFRPTGPNASDEVERVLPDGCLDIVFGPRRAVVVGTMTQALVIPGGNGVSYTGARFRAGMATAFLRISAASVTDGSAPLDALWSDARTVSGYVTPLLDADVAVGRLADVLVARLSRAAPVPDDVRSAVDAILSSGGRSEVEPIASSIGVSRQHLARRFAAYVGVPPKTLARVTRMREVVRLASADRVNWAGIAADLGYSDQSHLVTEFRSLTGLTPTRWAASHRRSSVRPEEAPGP